MALKGNLDDFNIVNILQMIKLEGKTGRLTLAENEEQVKITFDEGNIIYAEGTPLKDEKRIQSTLLSNSILKDKEWLEIQKEHEDKLKPYWEILSKKVTSQILVELISRQAVDTVYYALRWKIGSYEFTPIKNIKYNKKVMTPMDVDGLLMEGCRIADEWSRVSTSIPPFDTFIVKNIYGKDEEEDSLNLKADAGQVGDYQTSLEYEILSARGVSLNDSQIAVLTVVGAGMTIQELMDASRQNHFLTLEATQKLLSLEVLKPSTKKEKASVSADHTGAASQMITVAVLLAIIAGGVFWQVSRMPQTLAIKSAGDKIVKTAYAKEGLKKIRRAVQTYISLTGAPPSKPEDMVNQGVIEPLDLVDPWSDRYQIKLGKDNFTLFSNGPDINLTSDNVYLP